MCAVAFGLLLLVVVLSAHEPTLGVVAVIVGLVVAYGARGVMKPLEGEYYYKNRCSKPVRVWGEFLGILIACLLGLFAAALAVRMVTP